MSKTFTLYFFLLLIFPLSLTQAQDPHFSQFFASRVYLNPAYTGLDPGTTVTLNYRNQWFGIPDGDISSFQDSYRTYQVSFEQQLPCLFQLEGVNAGIGMSVFRDDAGAAPFTTQGVAFSFSHEQALIRKSGRNGIFNLQRLDLRVGAQLGFMQRSISGDYFIYSNQLDPVVGLLDPLSTLRLASNWYPSMNAGFMLRGYRFRSKQKNTLFSVGLSFSNANRPNESIRDVAEEFQLPMRTTFHFGSTHRISPYRGSSSRAPTYIAPQFRWDTQVGMRLNIHTLGAYVLSKGFYSGLFVQYNFPSAEPVPGSPLANNVFLRNSTTLILNAGVDLRSLFDHNQVWSKRGSGLVLGFTYDINLTGLTSASTLGVLEFNLRMNFEGKKRKAACGEIGQFELYNGACPVRF